MTVINVNSSKNKNKIEKIFFGKEVWQLELNYWVRSVESGKFSKEVVLAVLYKVYLVR